MTVLVRSLSHSSGGLRPTVELLNKLRNDTRGVNYDTLLGIGISGALVIPAVGRAARKHWALIRKQGVYGHAQGAYFEGEIGERFVIVDDWIDSGATVATILDRIRAASNGWFTPHMPRFVGVWQYTVFSGSYLDASEACARFPLIDAAHRRYTS